MPSASAPSSSATRRKRATVAGGGLLGLEAAYALHQLGVRATVLERSDRLLKRQLDARAAALLQRYLEGLGLEIVTSAETKAVSGQGRLDSIHLADGRRSTPRSCSSPRASNPTPSWRSRPAWPPTAACSSTRACRRGTRTSSRPATSPSSRDCSPACGRSRSRRRSGGRRGGRRNQALRAGRPSDDPQSRGHRTHVDRSLRSGRCTRRRSPSKTPPGVTASSWWRTAASWARSSLGTPRRSRPSAPRSPAASTYPPARRSACRSLGGARGHERRNPPRPRGARAKSRKRHARRAPSTTAPALRYGEGGLE